MAKPSRFAEVEALIREIQRYLAYVEALRAAASERRDSGPNDK